MIVIIVKQADTIISAIDISYILISRILIKKRRKRQMKRKKRLMKMKVKKMMMSPMTKRMKVLLWKEMKG